MAILKEDSSNVSEISFKVRINAIRSNYTPTAFMTVRLQSCVKIRQSSFIKTFLLVLRIVPAELHLLKGIGARLYCIALSKSTSFPLRTEIAS